MPLSDLNLIAECLEGDDGVCLTINRCGAFLEAIMCSLEAYYCNFNSLSIV
jgi:hypothetical protein